MAINNSLFSKRAAYHVLFIFLIISIGLFNIKGWIGYNAMPHYENIYSYYPRSQILRESIFTYKNLFPLWNPYLMSGTPYHDGTSADIISYFGLLNLLLPNAFMATEFTYVLSYIMSGITMYILALYLLKNPKYAFITAIIFMLSGYTTSRFREGTFQICALSLLPLAFLFLIKAVKEKDWIKNTIICSILIAIQIKAGPDMKVTLFTSLLFGLYLFLQIIAKNMIRRLTKVVLIGVLLLILVFSFAATTILPEGEYIESSSRDQNTWEISSGRKTDFKDLFPQMAERFHKDMFKIRYTTPGLPGPGFKIGIIAFLLAIFAVYKKPKNKFILFLVLTVLLTISIVTASFVFYLLWKYIPPWESFRYVNRGYVLWSFSGSLLAGFGAKYLFKDLKAKLNLSNKRLNIVFLLLSILIIANLVIFTREPIGKPKCNFYKLLDNAYALNYIKEVKEKNHEIFRVHDWETTGIDWPTDPYTVTLGLEHIFGELGGWDQEYMNIFLSLAYRDPAKFWGILNVKYLTSRKPLNTSGFWLVKEFPRFESDGKCPPPNASTWNDPNADAGMKPFGQFLYENKEYLPRVYIAQNSILIVGKHENIMNMMYMLMLNPNFNPRNTVIIHGKESVNDYATEELERYKIIFLTEGSIDQNSGFLLKQYVDSGGILLPDIVNGQTQIVQEDIDNILQLFKEDLYPIPDEDVITKSFEKKIIRLKKPVSGWMVLSERYAMYKGWKGQINSRVNSREVEIERANGVVSAVYLNNESGDLLFRYMPGSFRNGSIITVVTIIIIVIYFAYRKFKKSDKEKDINLNPEQQQSP